MQPYGLGLYLRYLPAREGVAYDFGRVQDPLALATSLYKEAGILQAGAMAVRDDATPVAEEPQHVSVQATGSPQKRIGVALATDEQVALLRSKGMEQDVLKRYRLSDLSTLTFAQAAGELSRRASTSPLPSRLRPTA